MRNTLTLTLTLTQTLTLTLTLTLLQYAEAFMDARRVALGASHSTLDDVDGDSDGG